MSLPGIPKIIQAHDYICLSLGVLLNLLILTIFTKQTKELQTLQTNK